MTQIGDVEVIASARKRKRCDWCDEWIEIGHPARRWLWKDGAEVIPTRTHPECHEAMERVASMEGYGFEWTPGSFSRGCGCEHGACECANAKATGGAS